MELSKKFKEISLYNIEKFVKLQSDLLNLERSCEVEQDLARANSSDARELEKRGSALRRVVVIENRTGLFGRTVITFSKENSQPLPATSISNGNLFL